MLTDHKHAALLLEAAFLAFGKIGWRHQHSIDHMPGIEAGLVADIDHRCPAVDHAHSLCGRNLQQGAGAQLYFDNDHRNGHEERRRHQKRVSG